MGYPAQGYLRQAVGRPSKVSSMRWTMPKADLDAPCYTNGTSIDRRVDTCELGEGEVKPYPLGLDNTLRTSVWSIVMTENFSAF